MRSTPLNHFDAELNSKQLSTLRRKRRASIHYSFGFSSGDRWLEHGMIYTSSVGTYIDQTKVSRAFKQILREAGLPAIRFHDLRHTSIAILLENGTPVNTVQSHAGHSKASVTTDIYGHAMARSQKEAASLIEKIIAPLPNELL